MTNAKSLLTATLVTVLLCAQLAGADPVATDSVAGQVTLTVEKYVDIRIPQGPTQFPGYPDVWTYPLRQQTLAGPGTGDPSVTPDVLGSTLEMTAFLNIHATANTPVWLRTPDHLHLTDHGTYQTVADVTLVPGVVPIGSGHTGGFWFARFASVSTDAHVLTAKVNLQPRAWTVEDTAGIYWGTLFVDIMASEAATPPASGWLTHSEPDYPPHGGIPPTPWP